MTAMPWPVRPEPPRNPFSDAIRALRARGYSCQPADIPGLTVVAGPSIPFGQELTMAQVVDLAASAGETAAKP